MMQEVLGYLCGLLLIGSAIFSLAAAIGILRLPDLYMRTHAASKAGTLGAGLALMAIALYSLDGSVALRAAAGFIFLLLTAPVSAHLLARAAYVAGYKPDANTKINELEKQASKAK
jgi:multicomponent Na+:H+ antiporter subunit G